MTLSFHVNRSITLIKESISKAIYFAISIIASPRCGVSIREYVNTQGSILPLRVIEVRNRYNP